MTHFNVYRSDTLVHNTSDLGAACRWVLEHGIAGANYTIKKVSESVVGSLIPNDFIEDAGW